MAQEFTFKEMATDDTDLDDLEGQLSSPQPDQQKQRLKKKKIKKDKHVERRFDWPKRNYFDTTCGDPSTGMKNLIHRFVYIAKLKEDIADRDVVGNHYEKLFKNLQNVHQSSEAISGLLLVYLRHMVHIVETSTDMILEIVRDMIDNMSASDGYLESAKILIISHDIPDRLYNQWSFRTLDIQAARMEGYDSNDSADKIVIDLLTQLLKLGNTLAKTPKLNLKNFMDSLHDKVPDLLPQQAVLHYLLEENDNCMYTPQEYLDLYETPFDVVLESELVWPLPTRLFPYK